MHSPSWMSRYRALGDRQLIEAYIEIVRERRNRDTAEKKEAISQVIVWRMNQDPRGRLENARPSRCKFKVSSEAAQFLRYANEHLPLVLKIEATSKKRGWRKKSRAVAQVIRWRMTNDRRDSLSESSPRHLSYSLNSPPPD